MSFQIVSAVRPIEEYFFRLPLPLSINSAYATLPNGRRVNSANKTNWTRLTTEQLNQAGFPVVRTLRQQTRKNQRTDKNLFTFEVTVRLAGYTRDIDNTVKLLLDLLCKRLKLNDNRCVHITIRREEVDTKEEEGVSGWVYVYDPPREGGNPRNRAGDRIPEPLLLRDDSLAEDEDVATGWRRASLDFNARVPRLV